MCKISSILAAQFWRYRDFSVFKIMAIGHLVFSEFWIFSSQSGWEDQYASLYQISSKLSKQLLKYSYVPFLEDVGHPPSLICEAHSGTMHKEYLVMLSLQNLVGIAALVLIIWKFEYFAHLAGKCLFTSLFGVFWGKMGDNGECLHFYFFYPCRIAIT